MRKAFTAIELMIVVAILMLLLGILVPVVSGMRERAKIRLAKSRLRTIALAIEQFRLSNGRFPQGDTDAVPGLVYDSLSNGFMDFAKDEIQGDGSPGTIAVDPWGIGWKYREHFAAFNRRMTEPQYRQQVIDRRAHNPAGFDLWSWGPNMTEDAWMHDMTDNDNDGKIDEYKEKSAEGASSDDEIGDDICNW